MRLIPDVNAGSADPVMAVRWCLDRSETEKLKAVSAAFIHVLFVIAYEGTKLEDRVLVPIDQMMTFLTFRRPGNHTVYAKVVYGRDARHWASSEQMLLANRNSRQHDWRLLNHQRTELDEHQFDFYIEVNSLRGTTDLNVVVPKEHFPPEPAEWFKKLVNAGFSYPPFDQCEFRRRMLVLPLKLLFCCITVPFITLSRALCAGFLALCGMRHINFQAIIHPWRNDLEDVFHYVDSRDSWFNLTKDGRRRTRLMYFCHPLIYLTLFVTLAILKHHYHKTYVELMLIGVVAIAKIMPIVLHFLVFWFSRWRRALIGIAIGSAVGFAATRFFLWAWRKSRHAASQRKIAPEFQKVQAQEKEQSYDELYTLLACKPNLVPALSAIPQERRTFHLRYMAFKAKVCRPFAAS